MAEVQGKESARVVCVGSEVQFTQSVFGYPDSDAIVNS